MKLLIVDDEYHVIKTVRYLLQISPIQFDEIFEAQSAKDAITIIERERPEILITDVLMADVTCLLYTSPSPRDLDVSGIPSSS